ncbi:MAG: cbb3-type cytochrome c oxidase subunit 3 [Pseudomonadota bacterium]
MDINDLRGISTAFMLVAFLGLVFWAYSSKRKSSFDEAANLPFADDDEHSKTGGQS